MSTSAESGRLSAEVAVAVTNQIDTEPVPAVSINGVAKAYSSCFPLTHCTPVLHDLTFTIQQGTICGLLGPSGCGKTTLLNCLVGQVRVDSGTVSVFGHPVGSQESGVPGRRVGFMPQDISLSCDLKVKETLYFYGKLAGMSSAQIKAKSEFLNKLLELPPFEKFIDSLSGGQQRRVSLAVTLIHDPDLVILDEPTVGVDPIVRKRIWDHLFDLASNNKQTILITTHYIEEAAMAHTVEMMYDGTIICEGQPREVIERHNCRSLEAVFLKLCLKLDRKTQEANEEAEREQATSLLMSAGKRRGQSSIGSDHDSVVVELKLRNHGDDDVTVAAENHKILPPPRLSFTNKAQMCFRLPKFGRVQALTVCNTRKLHRHIGHFLIHVIVPSVILIIFNLTYGGFPKKIPLGVVNDDSEDLGAVLLSHINSEKLVLKYYANYSEGRQAVEVGDTWGILHVEANFSKALFYRVMYGSVAGSNDTRRYDAIRLGLDVTCHPVTMVILDTLNDAFIAFGLHLLDGTGLDPAVVSSPLTFTYDIFKRDTSGLMGFAAPGIIMCGIYFVAMANCILALLSDKSCGQFMRNIVIGVTELELLIGHMTAFSVAIFIQAITFIVVAFWILGIQCEGPVFSIFLLVLLHGLCGTAFGLCISTFCNSEFTSVMLGFGTFLPSVCLTGVVWPIESIPAVLQTICRLLPQAYVIESMRGVMKRGWTVDHPIVAYGFAANTVWISIFLIVSAVLLRIN